MLQKKFPDFFFLFLSRPLTDKIVQRSVRATDILFCVVNNAFLPEKLSACIINGNRFVDDLHPAAIFINDWFGFLGVWRRGRVRCSCALFRYGLIVLFFGIEFFVHFNRAIPIRVGKKAAHISEVHHNKMGLAFFFAQTGSTANDLLKLSHRTNHFIQNNQLCHLAIRTRGEQLGGSRNNRIF